MSATIGGGSSPVPLTESQIATAGDSRYLKLAALAINKSAGYTVVASDLGTTIRATAALTLSLTAAATLGVNFMFDVVNNASAGNVVTIDPDGSETINGASTLKIFPGERATIICDGSNWSAFGLAPLVLLSSQSVTAVSSVSFVSLFDDAFSSFEVLGNKILGTGGNADLSFQVSANAGSTWYTNTGDYRQNYALMDQGGTFTGSSINNNPGVSLCQLNTSSTASFEIKMFGFTTTNGYKTTQQQQAGSTGGGLRYMSSSAQMITLGSNLVTGIRFIPSTGNLTGNFNLYGRR